MTSGIRVNAKVDAEEGKKPLFPNFPFSEPLHPTPIPIFLLSRAVIDCTRSRIVIARCVHTGWNKLCCAHNGNTLAQTSVNESNEGGIDSSGLAYSEGRGNRYGMRWYREIEFETVLRPGVAITRFLISLFPSGVHTPGVHTLGEFPTEESYESRTNYSQCSFEKRDFDSRETCLTRDRVVPGKRRVIRFNLFALYRSRNESFKSSRRPVSRLCVYTLIIYTYIF